MSGVNQMIYWRAQYGHTLIHGLLFSSFLSLSLYISLSFSVWPDRLIKTEERVIFAGPECFTSYNGVEGAGNSKAVE